MIFSNLSMTAMTAYHSSPFELENLGRWERGDWLLMEADANSNPSTSTDTGTNPITSKIPNISTNIATQYLLHLDQPTPRKGPGRKRRRLFTLAQLGSSGIGTITLPNPKANELMIPEDSTILFDNLTWEDLQWKQNGLTVRGRHFALRGFVWFGGGGDGDGLGDNNNGSLVAADEGIIKVNDESEHKVQVLLTLDE